MNMANGIWRGDVTCCWAVAGEVPVVAGPADVSRAAGFCGCCSQDCWLLLSLKSIAS